MAQKTKSFVDDFGHLILHRDDGSRRVQNVPSGNTRTRRSEMAGTSLHSLVAKYQRAGALPPSNLRHGDSTLVPKSRLDALLSIQEAAERFQELPLKVRQAIGHDPRRLEDWIVSNPQLALEHGLLVERPLKSSFPQAAASSSGAGEAKDNPTASAGGEVKA